MYQYILGMRQPSKIALFITLLIALSVVVPGTAKAESGTEVISAGKILSWQLDLPAGGHISYDIEVVSGGNIDVYVMKESEYNRMSNGMSFEYSADGSRQNTKHAVVSMDVPSGDYRLAIVNDELASSTVRYDLDGTRSNMGAAILGLVFLLVVAVIVVIALVLVWKAIRKKAVGPYPPAAYAPMPVQVWYCHNCGRPIPPDAIVCPYCAQQLRKPGTP